MQKKYLASGFSLLGHLGHVIDDLGLLSPAKFDERKREKHTNTTFLERILMKI